MATVNFSVPEEVKQAFNDCFAGENKSAVIAELMRRAVEERRRQARRRAAIQGIADLRRTHRAVTDDEISAARRADRP